MRESESNIGGTFFRCPIVKHFVNKERGYVPNINDCLDLNVWPNLWPIELTCAMFDPVSYVPCQMIQNLEVMYAVSEQ